MLCGLMLVLGGLRRGDDMLREREHPRTDLQMCVVRGAETYIKLKYTLLEREADSPPIGQKIRSLTDRQDACSSDESQDSSVLFRFRAAYKKDVTSAQLLFFFFALPADFDTPTMKRATCYLRE